MKVNVEDSYSDCDRTHFKLCMPYAAISNQSIHTYIQQCCDRQENSCASKIDKSLKNLNTIIAKITHIQHSVLVYSNTSGLNQFSQPVSLLAKCLHECTICTK